MSDVGPLLPEDVARRRFSTVFRGFDTTEVRSFLSRVAEQLSWARTTETQLREQLAAAMSLPAPELDEETLLAALGEETARIVRTAQQAAADIRAKAEENVTRILHEAHEEADRLRTQAESIVGQRSEEAELAATGIRQAAQAQSEAMVQDATWKAKEMLSTAEADRERILEDLNRRRREARQELELLHAGRERLLESYEAVRRSLDEIVSELKRAEVDARRAGDQAAARAATPIPEPATTPAPAPAPAPAFEPLPLPPPPPPSPPSAPVIELAPEPEAPPEVELVEVKAEIVVDVTDAPADVDSALAPEGFAIVEPPSDLDSVRVITPEPAAQRVFEQRRARQQEDAAPTPPPLASEVQPAAAIETVAVEPGPTPNADEALLQARDVVLDPLAAVLARRVKRALQDEQNDALDRLRSKRGIPSVDELLLDEASQLRRYADACRPVLDEAATAGALAAGAMRALRAGEHVAELAREVVEPLRRRLAASVDDALGTPEHAKLADGVGSAYREWKSVRIDRLVGDHLAAAYGAGVFEATKEATPMRWIVDDADGPCADCDDNALADPTPRGDAYPTGQPHPPAHPGCRCLLVPSDA